MFAMPYFRQSDIVLAGYRALNTRALNRFPRKKSRDGRWFAGSGSEVEIR
jgi:hypothetical protein